DKPSAQHVESQTAEIGNAIAYDDITGGIVHRKVHHLNGSDIRLQDEINVAGNRDNRVGTGVFSNDLFFFRHKLIQVEQIGIECDFAFDDFVVTKDITEVVGHGALHVEITLANSPIHFLQTDLARVESH